jgi:hypothetical protein
MDFPIDAIPIPDHSPKKIPKTPLDNQGSFREGLRFGIGRRPWPIHFFLMESKDANFLTHEESS